MRLLSLLTLPLFLHAQISPQRVPIPAGTTRQIVLQIAATPVQDPNAAAVANAAVHVVIPAADANPAVESRAAVAQAVPTKTYSRSAPVTPASCPE